MKITFFKYKSVLMWCFTLSHQWRDLFVQHLIVDIVNVWLTIEWDSQILHTELCENHRVKDSVRLFVFSVSIIRLPRYKYHRAKGSVSLILSCELSCERLYKTTCIFGSHYMCITIQVSPYERSLQEIIHCSKLWIIGI